MPSLKEGDHTSNWNSSISSWTSNFKIRSSSFSNVGPVGFFPARVLAVVPIFLVVAVDEDRETTPPLAVDELLLVMFGLWTGTRGFIGLTLDVVALETVCFLGEIAFAVALDLTGRAVTAGFVTGRDKVAGRVVVVLIGAVVALIVVPGRVGLVTEAVTAGRILASPWEEVLTGRTFVTGIFEVAALGFTVPEVGPGFPLEVCGSRNKPSSPDVGTKQTEGKFV